MVLIDDGELWLFCGERAIDKDDYRRSENMLDDERYGRRHGLLGEKIVRISRACSMVEKAHGR